MTIEIVGRDFLNHADTHINIDGAKNSVLPIALATLLVSGTTRIPNAPTEILDLRAAAEILRSFGLDARTTQSSLEITNTGPTRSIKAKGITDIRYSVLLVPILLRLFGSANVELPGGCNIGSRPIDIHLDGLRALGADCSIEGTQIIGKVTHAGADSYTLRYPSVTATESLILYAALGNSNRTIRNCATDPEVKDLTDFLIACGARIDGSGTSTVMIEGVKRLTGVEWKLIPDRIEVGTFAFAAVIMRCRYTISPIIPSHVAHLQNVLRSMGVESECDEGNRSLIVNGHRLAGGGLNAICVEASPYPGFPTDLQPLLSATCLLANGRSTIVDAVFPHRFRYLQELRKLGAHVRRKENAAIINESASRMKGTTVHCHDIRGGAACVLAALLADGKTVVKNEQVILRGYSRFFEKLRSLGVQVREVRTP